eukprot:tig00020961_g16664.t1
MTSYTCYADGQCGRKGGKLITTSKAEDQAFFNKCGKAGSTSYLIKSPGPPSVVNPACMALVKLTSTKCCRYSNGLRVWQLDSESEEVSLAELEAALAGGAEEEALEAPGMGGLASGEGEAALVELGAQEALELAWAHADLPDLL